MKQLRTIIGGLIFAAALATTSCGSSSPSGDGGTTTYLTADEAVTAREGALAGCPSGTHFLVCGTDGRTHSNLCRAGGPDRIAHVGACAGFVCRGVVCVAGFTCKTATNFGVATDSCVSDTGEPPACACADGEICSVEPSGATTCAPPPASRAFAPQDACANFSCPSGTSCRITTINFGVPAPTCLYD